MYKYMYIYGPLKLMNLKILNHPKTSAEHDFFPIVCNVQITYAENVQ